VEVESITLRVTTRSSRTNHLYQASYASDQLLRNKSFGYRKASRGESFVPGRKRAICAYDVESGKALIGSILGKIAERRGARNNAGPTSLRLHNRETSGIQAVEDSVIFVLVSLLITGLGIGITL
jgi:hypothetical protein